jgi:phytoene dehydrogenase-like protein
MFQSFWSPVVRYRKIASFFSFKRHRHVVDIFMSSASSGLLYLCGSGAHPGGGVTGAPGHNVAGAVIADLL